MQFHFPPFCFHSEKTRSKHKENKEIEPSFDSFERCKLFPIEFVSDQSDVGKQR